MSGHPCPAVRRPLSRRQTPPVPLSFSGSLLVENYTFFKIYQVKSYYTIHGEKYNKIYGSKTYRQVSTAIVQSLGHYTYF